MTAPRSVRFDSGTLVKLSAYAARRPGMTGSSAAALLVEEGLRMDAHPGVLFRDGPTGRRAVLAVGPDVWEIIRAIRDTRVAEPDLHAEDVLGALSDNSGLDIPAIRVALGYYGAFAEEIDAQVAAADTAESELEVSLHNAWRLLDS